MTTKSVINCGRSCCAVWRSQEALPFGARMLLSGQSDLLAATGIGGT
jgi:hypothetical protein